MSLKSTALALLAGLSALHASSVSWVQDIPLPSGMTGSALRYADTAFDDAAVYLFSVQQLYRLNTSEGGNGTWELVDNAVLDIRMDSRTAITRNPDGGDAYLLNQPRTVYQYNLPALARLRQWGPLAFGTVNSVISDGAVHILISANSQASQNKFQSFDLATGSATNLLPSGTVGSSTIGAASTLAIGPDGYVRLLDSDNQRVLTLGTNTADISNNFIGEFTLDITTTAISSIAMSRWGNIYIGDGLGGGSIYTSSGTLLGTFGLPAGTTNDPNVSPNYNVVYNPYINVKSDGTIYVSDQTGFHQYYDAAVVPEPSTAGLVLGAACAGVIFLKKRRKS